MEYFWDRNPMRDAIAFQFVRYDRSWFLPMHFRKTPEKPLGCFPVSSTLKKHVDDLVTLIDGAP